MRRLPVPLAIALLVALLLVPAARADGPLDFTTVRLPGIDGSGTEPRIAVAPDDTRYAMTNVARARGSGAVVFRSVDEGQTWQRTASDPVQRVASIDVDVVAQRSARGGSSAPSSTTRA